MKVETKIIIPAAGYGTRMGSPQAKELLAINSPFPLIQHALNVAHQLKLPVHVITRKEKVNLIEYLSTFDYVQIQIIEPSKEWPDTILQSEPHWGEHNLLILPDTIWNPPNIEINVLNALHEVDLAVGYFTPQENRTWGTFDLTKNNYELCEKPLDKELNHFKAWGLLAYKKGIGRELFSKILESTFDHQKKITSFRFKAFALQDFNDLTRC